MATAAEGQLRLDLVNPFKPGRYLCRCRECEMAREVESAERKAAVGGRGERRLRLLQVGRE